MDIRTQYPIIWCQAGMWMAASGRIIAASFYPALNNEEFEVYLQPKFLLDKEKVYGAEALARWRRLDGRYHNPNEFVSVLEKLGYIN